VDYAATECNAFWLHFVVIWMAASAFEGVCALASVELTGRQWFAPLELRDDPRDPERVRDYFQEELPR